MDTQPTETPKEDRAEARRTRAIEIAERALAAVDSTLADHEFMVSLIGEIAREAEFLLLDNDRKQLEVDGLTAENEKLRTSIAGNEREVPPEVTIAEQTQALVTILAEAHRRAQIGGLRSIALFWREGREVFVRANTRPAVAQPGDGKPTLSGMHGNHPWAAYFDGTSTVVVRFGAISTSRVLWTSSYVVGPPSPYATVLDAVKQAQAEFDRRRMA